MSSQAKLPGTRSVTGSGALADGPTLFDLQAGPMIDPCGLEAAPANRSVAPESRRAPLTADTSGRNSTVSYASAVLQRSLASRLRAALDVNGSPEYRLIWKEWDTRRREPICALRASPRRTSGSDCSGWRTTTDPGKRGVPVHLHDRTRLSLEYQATMTGWATASARDWKDGACQHANVAVNALLGRQAVMLAGWPTANTPSGGRSMSTDVMDATGKTQDGKKHTASLEHAVTALSAPDSDASHNQSSGRYREKMQEILGPTTASSSAETASTAGYRLNPRFSLWLMGFPVEWASCGALAMQSCRKSRRSS